MKNKRNITSFEAEKDVREMLVRAQGAGLKLGEICNFALRKFGRQAISDLASEQAAKLKRAGFNFPPEMPLAVTY